jgi:hypothetical protein
MYMPLIGNLSMDLTIIAAAIGSVVLGVVLGHGRLRNTALSCYVGLVLASELATTLHGYLGSLSMGTVRLILLGLPILLLAFGRRKLPHGPRQGVLLVVVLAVATVGLVTSSILMQLDDGARQTVLGGSTITMLAYNFRFLWLGLVPVLVMLEGFVKQGEDKHH